MNGLPLLLLTEAACLVFLTGLMLLIYGLRRAPVGFQHYNLFHYGTPPNGVIPVETVDSVLRPSDWA